ncbi:MAG: hypothetical protein JO356_07950 [Acidobacteria bacterium]|nr:hypothetical protein [Acidobacteriota bacterium]
MARTRGSPTPLTDHDRVRQWAEPRNVRPACVKGTEESEDVGMIRLEFPAYSGEESLEQISWDHWFNQFDARNLALLIEDQTARGQKSNFNKLVSRETARVSERRRESVRPWPSRSSDPNEKRTAIQEFASDLDFDEEESEVEEEFVIDKRRLASHTRVASACRPASSRKPASRAPVVSAGKSSTSRARAARAKPASFKRKSAPSVSSRSSAGQKKAAARVRQSPRASDRRRGAGPRAA